MIAVSTGRITRQGQISIPAKIRKKLGIKIPSNFFMTILDGKIIIQPIPNLLDMQGSLSGLAIKNKSTDQVIKIEETAAQNYVLKKFSNKQK
ncbi:AbrB/MazE/SpoVT family DNA-binding domain-containing protein [Patescibacteria group bacterium]|nr:AbrB/MazE/SpoVT family DNA-binding domain-containing protein [Patescibacteria group bacterium]MCG2702240.1 AbrB/MazE/SpoVT family DNA-binding domain-containing protein [Candidatus Parcubacteria bacterium]MBU4210022.1 AbrB/MazE/SpoVT family DNA-binding domain-containing protein [Patescibacteria group bacterium]MBU4264746.1 AbrB/MazE/SpoVT family DNA-binding domain-containing protein [Patescibacteria group bacterium]MBU4390084.1 AbrB/MazE/SpoVT family DNA-binding domain-containing protein [Pat